ncbi:MAG: universal stress protein [SAR324 cluster bacterium]|nr:universal stress protein [SAR324 cluster bacterium]
MLKRILVPLDSSKFTTAAMRMAANIANREKTSEGTEVTLVGLGIVDLDQLPSGRFSSVVDRDQIIAEAEQESAELIATFRAEVGKQGIPNEQIETKCLSGSPFNLIIRESVFSDLIVMGEKCSFPPVNQDYETMHNLYHVASRPIILAEHSIKTVETVVMAMDGTAPSSRMMYHYVHSNPFPKSRMVLTFAKSEVEEFGLENYFERVEQFLTSYGLNVSTHPIEENMEQEIGGVIEKENAQLLALGVHRDHFLSWFSDPLKIRQNFTTRLLRDTSTSLFVFH